LIGENRVLIFPPVSSKPVDRREGEEAGEWDTNYYYYYYYYCCCEVGYEEERVGIWPCIVKRLGGDSRGDDKFFLADYGWALRKEEGNPLM
jgi:hypothetical protein